MSIVTVQGNASGTGTLTIAAPNTNSNYTINLPTVTGGNFVVSDSSGNVGIGTDSPSFISGSGLVVERSGGTATIQVTRSDASILGGLALLGGSAQNTIESAGAKPLTFEVDGQDRMRIDSSGNILFDTTGLPDGTSVYGSAFAPNNSGRMVLRIATSATVTNQLVQFYNGNGQVGNISTSASATTYGTSSDYRLKEDIAPMTGALAKVALLKPCTYKWKVDGSDGQGFIAHELQAIVPDWTAILAVGPLTDVPVKSIPL